MILEFVTSIVAKVAFFVKILNFTYKFKVNRFISIQDIAFEFFE